jgi:hypothetical protein
LLREEWGHIRDLEDLGKNKRGRFDILRWGEFRGFLMKVGPLALTVKGLPVKETLASCFGKSQISRRALLPTVTPPISGTVMEMKKTANLREERKWIVGNTFQYGNLAINDEGQPRVFESSHSNVKGQEKRVNKGIERGKRKDGNGLKAHHDKLHSDSSTKSYPNPPRKLQKAQYVGSWDSKLGKMVYHLLGEWGTVLKLKKDPRDNTYFPHVAGATSAVVFNGHVSLKDGANSSDVTPLSEKQSTTKTGAFFSFSESCLSSK